MMDELWVAGQAIFWVAVAGLVYRRAWDGIQAWKAWRETREAR